MPFARSVLVRCLHLAAASALLAASALHAQGYADITALLKDGKASQALVQIEQQLASNPKDPQLRFLRGVAQSESKQTKAAIETFTALTSDYPELPEPYNNLAVLYAQENQLDKARTALEMAIRTNPSYATAHENLGDIYAKLAGQAYSKALQLDAGQSGAIQPKLALIRELFPAHGSTAPQSTAAKSAAAQAPVAAEEKPASAPAQPPAAPAAAPASSPTAAPAGPSAAAAATADEQAISAAIGAWAQAWAAKDMAAYLAAYASDFTPPGGQPRAAWEKDRHARIVGKKHISVQVSDLQVKANGDQATASFRQDYRGDALHVNSTKKLSLVKQDGNWKIARESAGK